MLAFTKQFLIDFGSMLLQASAERCRWGACMDDGGARRSEALRSMKRRNEPCTKPDTFRAEMRTKIQISWLFKCGPLLFHHAIFKPATWRRGDLYRYLVLRSIAYSARKNDRNMVILVVLREYLGGYWLKLAAFWICCTNEHELSSALSRISEFVVVRDQCPGKLKYSTKEW
jgi:hypothetical protein